MQNNACIGSDVTRIAWLDQDFAEGCARLWWCEKRMTSQGSNKNNHDNTTAVAYVIGVWIRADQGVQRQRNFIWRSRNILPSKPCCTMKPASLRYPTSSTHTHIRRGPKWGSSRFGLSGYRVHHPPAKVNLLRTSQRRSACTIICEDS